MSVRVIVNGAQGKMGQIACETLKNSSNFELVGALGRNDNLMHHIRETSAEIVIDLTRADAVYDNSLMIIEANARPVIGTSGLNTEEIKKLGHLCSEKNLGGIIVPNFSIAAVLMMQFAAQAARYLNQVEIIEMHHPQKFDAPSGTAMKTAEVIAAAFNQQSMEEREENELILGARGGQHEGIRIHSLRLAGVLAKQEVIFGNQGETLSLIHESIDRSSFMPGLLLACQQVMGLNSLVYGLESLLN